MHGETTSLDAAVAELLHPQTPESRRRELGGSRPDAAAVCRTRLTAAVSPPPNARRCIFDTRQVERRRVEMGHRRDTGRVRVLLTSPPIFRPRWPHPGTFPRRSDNHAVWFAATVLDHSLATSWVVRARAAVLAPFPAAHRGPPPPQRASAEQKSGTLHAWSTLVRGAAARMPPYVQAKAADVRGRPPR